MRGARVLAGTAIAAAALITVTGCGGSSGGTTTPAASTTASATQDQGNGIADQTPEEILAAAQDAAKAQASVHVKGSLTQGGRTITMDLSLDRSKGGAGTIGDDGATFEVVSTGSTAYVRADAETWTKLFGKGAATLLGDKWIKATKGDGLEQLAGLADYTGFLDSVLGSAKSLTKTDVTTVDGVQAVGLKDDSGTLYVAATGDPLPVAIDGGKNGKVTFSDWGKPVTITEPAAKDVIDPSQLGQ